MSEKGLTNISLKKINKSKSLPVHLQKKTTSKLDRSGTADGFIHCQSEPESSGTGRSY